MLRIISKPRAATAHQGKPFSIRTKHNYYALLEPSYCATTLAEIVNLVKSKGNRKRDGLKQRLLKIWFVDEQHQLHLGTCEKCKFLSHLRSSETETREIELCNILTSLSGESYAC